MRIRCQDCGREYIVSARQVAVLVDMYQHCQDRDAEDRAARLEDMQREYEMQRVCLRGT